MEWPVQPTIAKKTIRTNNERRPGLPCLRSPFATGARFVQSGFTLLELIITLTIIAILAAGTAPIANNMIKREKERELRRSLREIRQGIDSFCIGWNNGVRDPFESNGETDPALQCYPKNLKILVDGIPAPNKIDTVRYLRRIPIDPFTGNNEWGVRSASGGETGGGNHVFDVYSLSSGTALDGSKYSDW